MIDKKIVLNCLPPSLTFFPSPALSVLKSYLVEECFNVEITYWNIILKKLEFDFFNFGEQTHNHSYSLMVYGAILAIEYQDEELLDRIVYSILSFKPQYHHLGRQYIKDSLIEHSKKVLQEIDNIINDINLNEYLYWGFSSKFYQWIPGSIICKRIKERNKNLPIVVGGFSTKDQAFAYLSNFTECDFAFWGESEHSITMLSKYLLEKDLDIKRIDLKKIPNILYRDKQIGQIKSNISRNVYIDVNEIPLPDFNDYIKSLKLFPNNREISLTIEGGRSCHWKRCHFCFLNTGYKFRTKSPMVIKKEIIHQIQKYNIYSFIFLDNDIVGDNIDRFNELLSLLFEVKKEYAGFKIILAEFTTKYLTYSHMKKMKLSGFTSIQIGYESPSNKLLEKIEKENTFASNLFVIKWMSFFNLKIDGLNVLRNLIEEEISDILEGIDNIFLLRFFLKQGAITHNMSFLAISKSSPYYSPLEKSNKLNEWHYSSINNAIPKNYVNKENQMILFDDYVKLEYNKLWDIFEKLNEHYSTNEYSYDILESNGIVYYTEYFNGNIINEIEFILNDLSWKILTLCNKEIMPIGRIIEITGAKYNLIKDKLNELVKEGLIYFTEDFSEVVSIINTDLTE